MEGEVGQGVLGSPRTSDPCSLAGRLQACLHTQPGKTNRLQAGLYAVRNYVILCSGYGCTAGLQSEKKQTADGTHFRGCLGHWYLSSLVMIENYLCPPELSYLPPPWGDCQSTVSDSDFFRVYSITACRIDCETRYLVENCNCKMVHMPGMWGGFVYRVQFNSSLVFLLAMLTEKNSNYCVCRTPCNLTRYNKELSMVKIPSKTSARYLEKKFNKTEKYIADNILVLDVFFEALNYETIEQKKAYEVAGLLGDIGGQMGLFIGASILTILELFDYLYEVMKDRLLNFLSKEEEEEIHDENMSTCDPMPNHSESISHTVSVPLQTTLGTLGEIAC
ncbi:UNVERIFIED_CONTAM: hypothetical protein FKN15_034497 [Acipenser sinensis]